MVGVPGRSLAQRLVRTFCSPVRRAERWASRRAERWGSNRWSVMVGVPGVPGLPNRWAGRVAAAVGVGADADDDSWTCRLSCAARVSLSGLGYGAVALHCAIEYPPLLVLSETITPSTLMTRRRFRAPLVLRGDAQRLAWLGGEAYPGAAALIHHW